MHKVISWNFAAGAAGSAFLLSAAVGLISGVGFGSLLLRALASGLLFALMAAGGELLMRSFFPELLPESPSGDRSEASAEEESETVSGAAVDITVDDEEPDTVEGQERSSGDEFVEEVEQRNPEPQLAVETEESDDGVENLESVDSMQELPSLDGFSDSFESSYGNDEESAPVSGGSAKDVDVDIMGEAQSAGEVAQAVKTMLKRDQEG